MTSHTARQIHDSSRILSTSEVEPTTLLLSESLVLLYTTAAVCLRGQPTSSPADLEPTTRTDIAWGGTTIRPGYYIPSSCPDNPSVLICTSLGLTVSAQGIV